MSAQGGKIPLETDTTFRLGPNAGDYLLWVRCANSLCNPPEFVVVDFWEFREGDSLLITNRQTTMNIYTGAMEKDKREAANRVAQAVLGKVQ